MTKRVYIYCLSPDFKLYENMFCIDQDVFICMYTLIKLCSVHVICKEQRYEFAKKKIQVIFKEQRYDFAKLQMLYAKNIFTKINFTT